MGVLLDVNSGRRHVLATRNLVGRSRSADLFIHDAAVSCEHAVIWWDGIGWRVRDLASRNGTRREDERIEPGDGVTLGEHATVVFGADHNRWQLVDPRGPRALARDLESGALVEADGDLLVLPDEDAPVVTIYRDFEGHWVVEEADRVGRVKDLSTIVVGSTPWRLSLPEPQAGTMQRLRQPSIETVALEFEVSRDLEHVQLIAIHGGRRIDLKARAHHYPLYVLAEQRLRDQLAHPDLPPESHGWVYQDDFRRLCGGMDDARINLAVFRARKQLAAAGIEGSASLVERRTSTRQLRIGVGRLSIRSL